MEESGKGVKWEVKDGKLHLEVDLKGDFGPSKSGRTRLIGSAQDKIEIGDDVIKWGLNVFRPL